MGSCCLRGLGICRFNFETLFPLCGRSLVVLVVRVCGFLLFGCRVMRVYCFLIFGDVGGFTIVFLGPV